MALRDPFARIDPSDDAIFYIPERKVVHIEAGAIDALRSVYAEVLPPGGRVLDLMSSWRSHLPDGLGPVTGLGMNEAELADNPQLDQFVIHDLNRTPVLPFADASFDGVACAVSVQYLIHPVEVSSEVRRVLVPGGPFVVSFSNRCFPTKAVAIWMAGSNEDHRALVSGYLTAAGFSAVRDDQVPTPDDPLWVVQGRAESAP